MKIEVWSDFVCPFCYVGIHRLLLAIEQLPFHENIYIEFKSYELNPNVEKNDMQNVYELLSNRYHLTTEKAQKLYADIEAQAAEIGLECNLDSIQYLNTFDAHRLTKYAAKHSKGNVMAESLLKAYFTESENISDHATLIRISQEIGLNPNQVEDILQTCKYTKSVRLDEEQAQEMGIQTVPFFVFNEKYAISGAQSVNVFISAITQVWQEESKELNNEFRMKKSKKTLCCDSEGCYIIEDD